MKNPTHVVLQDIVPSIEPLAPRLIEGNKLRHKFLRLLLSWFPIDISSRQVQARHVELKVDAIFDQIASSQSHINMIWNNRVDTLLMGPESFDEYLPPLSSRVDFRLGEGTVIRDIGISVVMVPWMQGWALLDSRLLTQNSRGASQ